MNQKLWITSLIFKIIEEKKTNCYCLQSKFEQNYELKLITINYLILLSK